MASTDSMFSAHIEVTLQSVITDCSYEKVNTYREFCQRNEISVLSHALRVTLNFPLNVLLQYLNMALSKQEKPRRVSFCMFVILS